jgi:hypothetical protein
MPRDANGALNAKDAAPAWSLGLVRAPNVHMA